MFRKRLFGYSEKQVNQLIKQISDDFQAEEATLKDRIRQLEADCELLKNENIEDRAKLDKARGNSRYFMKAINRLIARKS